MHLPCINCALKGTIFCSLFFLSLAKTWARTLEQNTPKSARTEDGKCYWWLVLMELPKSTEAHHFSGDALFSFNSPRWIHLIRWSSYSTNPGFRPSQTPLSSTRREMFLSQGHTVHECVPDIALYLHHGFYGISLSNASADKSLQTLRSKIFWNLFSKNFYTQRRGQIGTSKLLAIQKEALIYILRLYSCTVVLEYGGLTSLNNTSTLTSVQVELWIQITWIYI